MLSTENKDRHLLLGVDIGGTFTDIVVVDRKSGKVHTYKQLTTSDNPSVGVIDGIKNLFARDALAFGDVGRVVHATTLFTNALIQRNGARTGLITTEGFRDVLEIGHERKYELYDLYLEMPKPLVPRQLRSEVRERTSVSGLVTELDGNELVAKARELVDCGVEALAVSFLHSYVDPTNEKRAEDLLKQEFPALAVSCSYQVSPQIREFERTSTTVANAYVMPLADSYLEGLEKALKELGIESRLFLMLSSGGLTNVEEAKRKPIELLESGPAAGALSASYFARRNDTLDILAFDMGGTTAKLAIVDDGEPLIEHSFEAAREKRFIEGSGLPLTISTIDLIEIGAGGGSIAHVDQLGLLTVGPKSAGSMPGPACYELGGTEPTVTDANLKLGYLNPDYFAGGTMAISVEAAEAALQRLADKVGLSASEVAWGIHNSVNENMASAARVHIAELGKDARRYTMLPTGGGGPLHCCEVSRKLGISRVICPPSAGVASAVGLLVAPARVDRARTYVATLVGLDWTDFESAYRALETDAAAVIEETLGKGSLPKITRFADMRYVGQGFDLVVALPDGPYTAESMTDLRNSFAAMYREIFGRSMDAADIQVMNIRIAAQMAIKEAALQSEPHGKELAQALKHRRKAYFESARAYLDTPVYARSLLPAGASLDGPAIVEEPESTLIVPPGASFAVAQNGAITIDLLVQNAHEEVAA